MKKFMISFLAAYLYGVAVFGILWTIILKIQRLQETKELRLQNLEKKLEKRLTDFRRAMNGEKEEA